MIIATRSNTIYSSPRIEKYIEFYESKGLDFLVIGWDRLEKNLKRDNTIYYRRASGYNVGGLKATINRLGWMFFLLKIFYRHRKKITVIHAFDLDTAFPACVFKLFVKHKTKVIFDICDWFSATLYNQNILILGVFKKMEKFTIKHSDEVIICEPERIEQIPYKLNRKELIVPNIPSFPDTSFLQSNDSFNFHNEKIVFAYVGGFSGSRNLHELLTMAEQGLINLLIAGYGTHEIEKRCEKASLLPNVKYFGKVAYMDGLNIMYNSQIIYAMYSKSNPNHYYAAPNKYYEAMMLGKPILSTAGISLGNKILINEIGYVVEENLSDLISLVKNLDRREMVKKGQKASLLWKESFISYTSDFLHNKYSDLISNN
jgi:glycosyltransferase involved in cell wall biosynthesis